MRNTQRLFEQKGYTITTPPANVVDRSRYGNNATLSGGAVYKKVRDLYVLDFTLDTAKATITKNSSINNLTQFTIRGWLVTNSNGAYNDKRFYDKNKHYLYADTYNNKLVFARFFSVTNGFWSTPVLSLSKNIPHCVQITYDNSSTSNDPVIMIDGVSVAITETTTPSGVPVDDSAYDLILGNREANDRPLKSYLSEVEILSGIASVADGKRFYNSTCRFFGKEPIA